MAHTSRAPELPDEDVKRLRAVLEQYIAYRAPLLLRKKRGKDPAEELRARLAEFQAILSSYEPPLQACKWLWAHTQLHHPADSKYYPPRHRNDIYDTDIDDTIARLTILAESVNTIVPAAERNTDRARLNAARRIFDESLPRIHRIVRYTLLRVAQNDELSSVLGYALILKSLSKSHEELGKNDEWTLQFGQDRAAREADSLLDKVGRIEQRLDELTVALGPKQERSMDALDTPAGSMITEEMAASSEQVHAQAAPNGIHLSGVAEEGKAVSDNSSADAPTRAVGEIRGDAKQNLAAGPERAWAPSDDTARQAAPSEPSDPEGAPSDVNDKLEPDDEFEKFLAERTKELPEPRKTTVMRLACSSFYGALLVRRLYPELATASTDTPIPKQPGHSMRLRPKFGAEDVELSEKIAREYIASNPSRYRYYCDLESRIESHG